MWHEARRQEKLVRTAMIDSVRRKERKKQYYDSIRKDPEQFMQIHGHKYTIHTDPAVARAADDTNILRPWQGDASVLIDRFDARSHLDVAPTKSAQDEEVDKSAMKEDQLCDFERYRILVVNEFQKGKNFSNKTGFSQREVVSEENCRKGILGGEPPSRS